MSRVRHLHSILFVLFFLATGQVTVAQETPKTDEELKLKTEELQRQIKILELELQLLKAQQELEKTQKGLKEGAIEGNTEINASVDSVTSTASGQNNSNNTGVGSIISGPNPNSDTSGINVDRDNNSSGSDSDQSNEKYSIHEYEFDKFVSADECAHTLINLLYYSVCYNTVLKAPEWVVYELQSSNISGSARRSDSFRDYSLLPSNLQASPKSFYKTGYDRGHMAPSAAFKLDNASQADTFYMINIAPQTPELNRGVWRSLESNLRKLALAGKKTVVVTGNYLDIEPDTLKVVKVNEGKETKVDSGIAIPSYSYKVVLHQNNDNQWATYAFKIPNLKYGLNSIPAKYQTSVAEIQEEKGIDFFHFLEDALEKSIESEVSPLNN